MIPGKILVISENSSVAKFYNKVFVAIDTILKYPEHTKMALEASPREAQKEKSDDNQLDGGNWRENIEDEIKENMDVIESVTSVLDIRDEKKLKNIRMMFGKLAASANNLIAGDAGQDAGEIIRFVKIFSEHSANAQQPFMAFKSMLGNGTSPSYPPFQSVAKRFFECVFFFQRVHSVDFYEFALISNICNIHFSGSPYFCGITDRMALLFITGICKNYVGRRPYKFTMDFILEMRKVVLGLSNAFNGIVNELSVEESTIPKIVYIILVFHWERRVSIFMNTYGVPELLYCAIRTFYREPSCKRRIEDFMRKRLKWTFVADKNDQSLSGLFQTVYKYEYFKILGSITSSVTPTLEKFGKPKLSPDVYDGKANHKLVTRVVSRIPKMDQSKVVKAFSPLSRRIGEKTENKESFDSRRKLQFE